MLQADSDRSSIISTVLHWDVKDLEHRAGKIERERAKLGKDQLATLKDYAAWSRDEQDKIRKQSQNQSISIVTAVLRTTSLESELTDVHHTQALEYLSIHLSIRDRKEIIKTLCTSHPDHFTTSIRQLVEAYDPVIRGMHKAIDLSGTINDLECFLRDMIKLAKIQTDRSGKSTVPTVGDFIMLLRKHQHASHSFIHQCCKNGPELTSWYLAWAKTAASHFQRHSTAPGAHDGKQTGAGNLQKKLNDLFDSLDESIQQKLIPILDSYTAYLNAMHEQSLKRLSTVIRSPPSKNPAIAKIFSNHSHSPFNSKPNSRASSPAPGNRPDPTSATEPDPNTNFPSKDPDRPTPTISSDPGPGAYLTRWQDLLDNTSITPLTQHGKVKSASSPEVVNQSAADVDGEKMVEFEAEEARGEKIEVRGNKKPDVRLVVEKLGDDFRKMLAEDSLTW